VVIDVEGRALAEGEVEDMADQVLEGTPPRVSLEDSRANVATLEALHRSAAEGRVVTVSDVLQPSSRLGARP
jgi:predicted dehydrogenase